MQFVITCSWWQSLSWCFNLMGQTFSGFALPSLFQHPPRGLKIISFPFDFMSPLRPHMPWGQHGFLIPVVWAEGWLTLVETPARTGSPGEKVPLLALLGRALSTHPE